jgi:hypothetical protein
MINNQLLKLSQSRFVRIADYILPVVALAIAAYYFFIVKDMGSFYLWLATGVVGFILSIANITKLMHRFLLSRITKRG